MSIRMRVNDTDSEMIELYSSFKMGEKERHVLWGIVQEDFLSHLELFPDDLSNCDYELKAVPKAQNK